MQDPYADITKRLQKSVLSGPGTLDPEVRQHAASTVDVPDELASYVQKVSRYAYKVTDDDMALLRQKGYSEDQIFELTVSVALGAGLSRLEAGLKAIQEGK